MTVVSEVGSTSEAVVDGTCGGAGLCRCGRDSVTGQRTVQVPRTDMTETQGSDSGPVAVSLTRGPSAMGAGAMRGARATGAGDRRGSPATQRRDEYRCQLSRNVRDSPVFGPVVPHPARNVTFTRNVPETCM